MIFKFGCKKEIVVGTPYRQPSNEVFAWVCLRKQLFTCALPPVHNYNCLPVLYHLCTITTVYLCFTTCAQLQLFTCALPPVHNRGKQRKQIWCIIFNGTLL